ncbi:HMG (high mobility group) box family protein [Brugia pahangi]
MYHPTSLYYSTTPPSCTENNSCIDFGIYGIEQNDCYLDLNCIEPSLVPEEEQTYVCATAACNNIITTTSNTNETVVTDTTNQVTSRTSRRTIRKKRPKKDPNEPQKPVSAYALFFRDTQATIKGRSPNASFGEVSKIVASMWDSLDYHAKSLYKQRTEMAKKDYLKKLAAYRAQQISQNETVGPVPELEKGELPAMEIMNSANSSSEKQEVSTAIGEMTLANLIARPPSTNFASFYLHHRDVNQHQTLIHQYPILDFDFVPLIIEVIGIIATVAMCLLMHFIMQKFYEDADRPTFHHLIHNQYYSKQLDKFLNEQDKKNATARDLFSNKRDTVKFIRECLSCILKACIWHFFGVFSLQNLKILN